MLAREAGFDGSELHVRERPIPGTSRTQKTTQRCQPGSFAWRYGRGKPGSTFDVLFQAGSEFSRVVERAGLDGPGTVDWAKAGYSQWNGLPPARLVALDEWKRLTQDLGKLVTARLIQYVVQDKTGPQIAKMYGRKPRDMTPILDADLLAAAVYFGYAWKRK